MKIRIGYPPLAMKASGPLRLDRISEDAVATCFRAWMPVGPNLDAYALCIVPRKLAGRRAPESAPFNGGANYKDMVRGAVAQGYVVLAPHSAIYPFGDRDHATIMPAEVRALLDEKLRSTGASLAAVEPYKISLLLDHVLARPEVDPNRVAMIGLAYGGFYSLYTAALEPRIKVVVASFSFPDDPPITDGRTEGRLREMAPAFTDTERHWRQTDSHRSGPPRRALVYEKVNASDRFVFSEFDGDHEFRGDLFWPFLNRIP